MSARVPITIITNGESCVLGDQAVIAPGDAHVFVSVLHHVGYRHALGQMGLAPAQEAGFERAVDALRMVAHAHLAVTVSGAGNPEGNGTPRWHRRRHGSRHSRQHSYSD